tara:strand:- start:1712 stop:1960 length:249 start_codon:yes stop_codon:yes gene_type:complete
MGGIFKSKPAPGPSPKQIQAQEQAEDRAEAQEANEKRKLAMKSKSRRTGGRRQLMSQDRFNPALGNPQEEQVTLGPARNPRA